MARYTYQNNMPTPPGYVLPAEAKKDHWYHIMLSDGEMIEWNPQLKQWRVEIG